MHREEQSLREFQEIVEAHRDRVYNVCLGMMKDPADAEDLAQEVFITAYTRFDSFRGESNVSTWLYRVAVNKCLEMQRKKGRQKRSSTAVPLSDVPDPGSDQFYHPGVEMENRERSAILLRAMDQLAEGQRAAFVLQQLEGLSQAEIAQIMKKSESSVESLLHRAKANLRKILRSYYEEH